MSKEDNNQYEFAAPPKVVKPKKKYKQLTEEEDEEEIKFTYNNLMWDKRIVRGNTYAAIVTSKNVQIPHKNTFKQSKGNFKQQQDTNQEYNGTSGGQRRTNIQIFTDQFVETLTDKPPKYQKDCQTEFIIEKPIVRLYMKEKQGVDDETQIWDNQLFDFDYQVEPLLRVLCGKTLEIARTQVLQEEELRIMKERQKFYHEESKAENDKIKAMQLKEQKLKEQNDKKIASLKQKKQVHRNCHKKLFSRVIAKQFLKHVKTNTLQLLQGHGLFRNPIEIKLVQGLLPWIYAETDKQLKNQSNLLNDVIQIFQDVESQMDKQHRFAIEAQHTRKQVILKKRKQREQQKTQRKQMKQQQQHMKKYLIDLKIKLQREEQQRRLAAEKEAAEQAKQP